MEERTYLAYTSRSVSWKKLGQELKEDLKVGIMEEYSLLVCSKACSGLIISYVSYIAQAYILRMLLPTVGWALTYGSLTDIATAQSDPGNSSAVSPSSQMSQAASLLANLAHKPTTAKP